MDFTKAIFNCQKSICIKVQATDGERNMSTHFKKKLIDLYDLKAGHYGKFVPENELRNVLQWGAMGELGENYFLFLYRDFYRKTPYYGAVIFFNKRDRNENPVTVVGVEQNGKEQVRNVYIKAALFYLKSAAQDTMTISGNAASVFEIAKEKINTFIGNSGSGGAIAVKDRLEEFEVDLSDPGITFKEIEVKKSSRRIESPAFKESLLKLTEIKASNSDYDDEDGNNAQVQDAAVGLVLRWKQFDLTGEQTGFFEPVIVPVRGPNQYGGPQKATADNLSSFRFDSDSECVHEVLVEFLNYYTAVGKIAGSPKLKTTLMNRLFFGKLTHLLFMLPNKLSFSQLDGDKNRNPLGRLRFRSVEVRFAPSLEKASAFRFFLSFAGIDGQTYNARDNFEIIPMDGTVVIFFVSPDSKHLLAIPEDSRYFLRFFDFLKEQREFYSYDLADIQEALKGVESEFLRICSTPMKKYELTFLPAPVLSIYPPDVRMDGKQRLEIEFAYRDVMADFVEKHPDKAVCTYLKNEEFEKQCREVLKYDPFLTQQMDFNKESRSMFHYYHFKNDDPVEWLVERGGKYMQKGFKIFSIKLNRFIGNTGSSLRINLNVTKGGTGWLEFNPVLHDSVTGTDYDVDIESIGMSKDVVADKNGNLHLVSEKEIQKLALLYRYAEPQGNGFRVPSRNHILIRTLYEQRMDDIAEVRDALQIEKRLKEFDRITDYPVSENFNGQLRDYQRQGFNWLCFLQDYGFAGCLADDMGLGKTVQTLALLQTLKDNGNLSTSLLVLPVSAVPNWESEIDTFTRGISYYRHLGTGRDKDFSGWKGIDIIITSYATLRNDIELLSQYDFDYIILDESQNIKNAASLVSKAVKGIKAKNKLALSGTPIENNSMELWSLFDFLMPGYLGNSIYFNRQFAVPIEKDKDETRSDLLKKMIFPFVLRRRKEEVASELPEKIEIVTSLQMEEEQQELYGKMAAFYRGELEREMESKGVSGSSMKILEGMLRLRQICLFPQLVGTENETVPSAKFEQLKNVLEDILSEDHKVLIFSQFVQALGIIKEYCNNNGIDYSYLDGSVKVKEREKMIRRFQENEETRVFLLSLKAGGVALNLTAADYVIIFDPWWNPAVEAQAIDRSHRIGQTRNVMVYRMVVKDSIEEKMLALQDRKKALVDNLITSDSRNFKDLDKEDILKLFSY
jgi:superfamily II DNA or RNA helicase